MERRVRVAGRPLYGRQTPMSPQPRRSARQWRGLSMWQRRLVWLAVIAGIVIFWLYKAFYIHTVVIQGTGSTTSIQAAVETVLQSSVWSQNLLTLDSGVVSSKLQQVDPALRQVQVQRRWPHTVVVTVVLQQPSLGWSSDGQEYLLDRDGTVIGSFPAGSKLPVVVDKSNLPVSTGKQVASERFVAFAQSLVPALAADGYTVTGMSIQDTTFDLSVTTNKGYALIFDTTRPVGNEITDLKAVQKVLAAQKQTPASYIDLRIAGKAYYK